MIPEVSSETARLRAHWLAGAATIPSNLVRILEDASLAEFALLTSAMHMAWLRHVGGRLESRYRYSSALVYNTFPLPPGFSDGSTYLSKLEGLAQAVLDARAKYPDATWQSLRPGPNASDPSQGAPSH